MNPIYYVAVIILIMLSGFFSGSEMAYSSANRVRLENEGDDGKKASRLACKIIDSYDDMLSAVLICNNLVNIAASSIVSVIAIYLAPKLGMSENLSTTLGTVLITLLIIVFGETMPKITAKKNANTTAANNAYVIRGLTVILTPLIFIVVGLVKLITKPMKGEKPEDEQDTAVEELVSIIETVEDEGVINNERSEMLQAALEFSEISASEVMTARVDMLAIDIDDDWDEIMHTIETSPYSRLPVYEDSIDNIIGVLYLNHFFKAISSADEIDIRPLLLEPRFVYKTVKLPSVLTEMREGRTHLVVVTDEYGGTMGVVTMEDVLEELVGEIWDETDEVEQDVIAHADNLYEIAGDMSMGDFLEFLDISEDSFETESSTVGGWTIENFGHFPQQGESFTYERFRVMVLETNGKRVEKVLLSVKPEK
ncbi:MAG: HlyC/CorC family transporter [Clostridia bacterium]|nr:HlyC/CorC family transporter [Clostridia bacterium]